MKKIAEFNNIKKAELHKLLSNYGIQISRVPQQPTIASNIDYNPKVSVYILKEAEEQETILLNKQQVKIASEKGLVAENVPTTYELVPIIPNSVGQFKGENWITEPVRINSIDLVSSRGTFITATGLLSEKTASIVLSQKNKEPKDITWDTFEDKEFLFIPKTAQFVKKASSINPDIIVKFDSRNFIIQGKNWIDKGEKKAIIEKLAMIGIPPKQANEICMNAMNNKIVGISFEKKAYKLPKNDLSMSFLLTKIAQVTEQAPNEPVKSLAQTLMEVINKNPNLNPEILSQLLQTLIRIFLEHQLSEVFKQEFNDILFELIQALDKFVSTVEQSFILEQLTEQKGGQ